MLEEMNATHATEINTITPLANHIQFPILVDTLIRKNNHHLILQCAFSSKIQYHFLEAFYLHLQNENLPHWLRNSKIIELKSNHDTLDQDLSPLLNTLNQSNHHLLFIVFDIKIFSNPLIHSFLSHPFCRFLCLTSPTTDKLGSELNQYFTAIRIHPPTESDLILILKKQKAELENYHQTIIPDEIVSTAFALTERFLNTQDTLEKTLSLLDSCAARTNIMNNRDHHSPVKSIMALSTLLNVLSAWTHIPSSCLPLHAFNNLSFIQGMQQCLFGQDAAITLLSQELSTSHIQLQQRNGPFCRFLFCGAKHSGKKTTALALAKQLFNQPNLVYSVKTIHVQSLLNVHLQRLTDKQWFSLSDIVTEQPHAIIVFEDIEQYPCTLLNELQEILSTGSLHSTEGRQYHFHQSILILTTTLGENKLAELSASSQREEESDVNFMQILMNDKKHTGFTEHHYSPHELAQEISTEVTAALTPAFCHYLRIIPFLPLTHSAIEHIMHLKISLLAAELASRHGIELNYAQEVIGYLASQAQEANIETTLKLLYFTIEQALLSQTDSKRPSNQLFLQLNETGQRLRCDWLMMTTPMRHHYS